MPSLRAARKMRTAISPRLAMRSFLIAIEMRTASNVDFGDRLPGHNGLFVLSQEPQDLARGAGFHLVERFHHLNEADRVAVRDHVTVVLVGFLLPWPCYIVLEQARRDLILTICAFLSFKCRRRRSFVERR